MLLHQNRRLPGRIEEQEIPPPLIGLFFDEFGFDRIFAEKQPDETRMRAKGMMIKRDHSASCSGAIETIGTSSSGTLGVYPTSAARFGPRKQTSQLKVNNL